MATVAWLQAAARRRTPGTSTVSAMPARAASTPIEKAAPAAQRAARGQKTSPVHQNARSQNAVPKVPEIGNATSMA